MRRTTSSHTESANPVTTPFVRSLSACILVLASCSVRAADDQPVGVQSKLETDDAFHKVAVPENAAKLRLPFDSYLIGIEKADSSKVGPVTLQNCHAGEPYCFDVESSYFTGSNDKEEQGDFIARRLSDAKSHFISHIVRYEQDPPSVGYIYNIYSAGNLSNGEQAKGSEGADYVKRGWDALVDNFALDLEARVEQKNATHIFVYSTGWNTVQTASIKNYSDWFEKLIDAYDSCAHGGAPLEMCEGLTSTAFRPIFIGLSWASDWPDIPLPGPADFVNKAHDADEVGLTWANLLVNKVLKEIAQQGTRIVLVGHSFGARVLSRAVHSAPLVLSNYDEPGNNPPIDLFIGLQGAFPYKRFVQGEGKEGSPYADFALWAHKSLFTTSANDAAVDKQIFSVYTGDDKAFEETRDKTDVFEHGTLVPDDGRWEQPPSMDKDRIGMLDGTAVVRNHNDVYNDSIARFVLQAVSRYAPARES